MLLHTYYAQAVGEVPVDLIGDLVESDMVTPKDHNFGSLKGVADLYV